MYIQITTRCNMHCDHCGFDCTHKGSNMSLDTFKNALGYCSEHVMLGGGEPTLHPKFWEFFGRAMGHGDVRACGCPGAPKFGDVNTGFEVPDEWNAYDCYLYNEKEMVDA